MSNQVPRLRMFAGPNGSGKSTLKDFLPANYLGVYLNPDEIEKSIRSKGYLDFSFYGLSNVEEDALEFFQGSDFLKSQSLDSSTQLLKFSQNRIDFSGVEINSYFASVAADFIRHKLMALGISFTFETVMSHVSKIEILKAAHRSGFRTYLYYMATDDPEINISRVKNRVESGGHDVPIEKVRDRYYRSLELLIDAIRDTDRAYVFDNSRENTGRNCTWLAEITDGKKLELQTDEVPAWFKKYVLDKALS